MAKSTLPYDSDRVNWLVGRWSEGLLRYKEGAELSRIIDQRVRYILRKINYPSKYEEDDLVSIGITAAFECVERWDIDQGDFMTFSFARIRGAMYDYLRKRDNVTRPNRSLIAEVQKIQARIAQEEGRPAMMEEVVDRTGYTVDEIDEAFQQDLTRQHASIFHEFEVGTDTLILLNILGSDDEGLDNLPAEADVDEALSALSDRSRLIVQDFYIRDMPQRDIALRHGLTEARISQIRKKALETLRAYFALSAVAALS